MSELPKGWEPAQLGHVVLLKTGPFGSALHQSDYVQGGTPLINPTHIRGGRLTPDPSVSAGPEKTAELKEFWLMAGDVVMGRRGEMGRCAVVPQSAEGWLCGTGSVIVRPTQAVSPPFLQRFLSAPSTVSALVGDSVGSTMVNLNQKILLGLSVALPPVAEQRRIADKLDTVLTRVDAVNTRLARVAPILKRFRQSVLAAATSGRLTEDWRALNSTSEPWRKARLEDLIQEMRNGLAAKPDENPEGRKILRISAVRPGVLDTTDHRYLTTDESNAKLYELRKGDLLFTRYNGSLEYVGVCAMVSEDLPAYVYPDKLIRVRAKADLALPKFIELASAAAEARSQIEGYVKSSAGQKGISGGNLKSLRIAVPSIEEQTEIVHRVETLFAFADRLEARLQTAQTATERLTPALLAKAFRGELVPQDPNDEPASELLKRLAAQAPTGPAKGRRAKASASAAC
jgi:type I restriction enzyme S subunit